MTWCGVSDSPREFLYLSFKGRSQKHRTKSPPPQKNKNIFRETAGSCEMSLAHVPISCNLAFHFLPVCPRTQAGTDWHIPPVYLMISVPEFFFLFFKAPKMTALSLVRPGSIKRVYCSGLSHTLTHGSPYRFWML